MGRLLKGRRRLLEGCAKVTQRRLSDNRPWQNFKKFFIVLILHQAANL